MKIKLIKMYWNDSELTEDDETVMFDIEELTLNKDKMTSVDELVTNFNIHHDYYLSRLPKLASLGLIEIVSSNEG